MGKYVHEFFHFPLQFIVLIICEIWQHNFRWYLYGTAVGQKRKDYKILKVGLNVTQMWKCNLNEDLLGFCSLWCFGLWLRGNSILIHINSNDFLKNHSSCMGLGWCFDWFHLSWGKMLNTELTNAFNSDSKRIPSHSHFASIETIL